MKSTVSSKDSTTPRKEANGTSSKEAKSRSPAVVVSSDSQEDMDTGETSAKRARLESSPDQPTSV